MREDQIELLMSRGMPRWDATTALTAHATAPHDADAIRVTAVLEWAK